MNALLDRALLAGAALMLLGLAVSHDGAFTIGALISAPATLREILRRAA